MKSLARLLVLSAAVAASVAVPLSSASARDWHHRHYHHGNGDALAIGALGLAAGAVIGGAIASDPGPRYYDAPRYYVDPPVRYYRPRVVYRAQPVYAGSLRPWSRGWYSYCADRYRSFDARSGTYRGYDGRDHFCVAD